MQDVGYRPCTMLEDESDKERQKGGGNFENQSPPEQIRRSWSIVVGSRDRIEDETFRMKATLRYRCVIEGIRR